MGKTGRNSPCPCGSGIKYKKCCGGDIGIRPRIAVLPNELLPSNIQSLIRQKQAQESIREQQQGLGRPIISIEHQGVRIVAVGNELHYSKDWKSFHDFLLHYIKKVLDGEWGNNEIAKPYEQRHIILQWYDQVCRYQRETIKTQGVISTAPMIGVVEVYMQLAYNLFLIGHNTIRNLYDKRLRERLIQRLKQSESFPGAYYESLVCAIFVLAGFEVEIQDETGGASKCDFVVTSKSSRKKYTVEAKAIRREGALGAIKNTTQTALRKSIRNQLYDALKKPSKYPRIILIDVNLPVMHSDQNFRWMEEAVDAVRNAEDLTIAGNSSEPAYVVLTNFPHHYHPTECNVGTSALMAGYKIEDFGHGKRFAGFREAYLAKQKHIDIHNLIQSLKTHRHIPSTFDGSLPSRTFHGKSNRLIIGETYHFEGIGENGLVDTVTTATVDKKEKTILIGTKKGNILKAPISDEELEDYERHPDSFFGVDHPQGKQIDDPYELFEWMLRCYSKTPKARLLELMKGRADMERLKSLSHLDLAIEYCEGCMHTILRNKSDGVSG